VKKLEVHEECLNLEPKEKRVLEGPSRTFKDLQA
jgi:hypothetical protein